MEEALSDIVRHHDKFLSGVRSEGLRQVEDGGLVCDGLNDIASHLRQVKAFLLELKTKLENILALVNIFDACIALSCNWAEHGDSFSVAFRFPMIEEW